MAALAIGAASAAWAAPSAQAVMQAVSTAQGDRAADDTTQGIRAITLSAGGVAEIRQRLNTDEHGVARLAVPLAQVDDILKSLVVRADGTGVVDLSLDGLAPEEEIFSALPFKAHDLQSLPRLAAALQGVKVQATSGGRTIEGRVLGVAAETGQGPSDQFARTEHLLSVLDDRDQVQTLRLGPDSVLAILDDKVRAQLRDASLSAARSRLDDSRVIVLRLGAPGQREVDVSYVIAAPVWKTAYRLQMAPDSKAHLQGWAILENATGDDWRQVGLTLTSGAPVVLSQRLHERYWSERNEVPVAVGAGARQAPDDLAAKQQAVQQAANAAGARTARIMRSVAPPAPAMAASPMADFQAEAGGGLGDVSVGAEAREGLAHVSFALPHPVDARKGATLSLPLLDARVQAQPLAVYRSGQGRHPVSSMELRNDTATSLPPGLVTIYDGQGAYAGDAELAGIPAGESRLLFFAEDRKVTVREDTEPEQSIAQASIADGVLTVRRVERRKTQYVIQGAADGDRTVLIEHPRQAGWTFKSDALDAETASHYRLRVPVAAGATVQAQAVAERVRSEQIALLDAEADLLLSWSGRVADEETAARLKDLAALKREWHAAAQAEQEWSQRREAAVQDQARVRQNLGAVPADSTLGQRYAALLAEQEDRIAELDRALDEARQASAALRQRFSNRLSGA